MVSPPFCRFELAIGKVVMEPISVLVVDDNPLLRRLIARFLNELDSVVVVGTAGKGVDTLMKALDLRPQVILFDLGTPARAGLDAIPRLRTLVPEAHIIAMSLLDGNAYRQAALSAGAHDFVAKINLVSDVLPAIQRVMNFG